jgi:hypothetical protein
MAHIYSYFLIGVPCPSTPGKNKFFPGSKINDFESRQGASAINTGNLTTPKHTKLFKEPTKNRGYGKNTAPIQTKSIWREV